MHGRLPLRLTGSQLGFYVSARSNTQVTGAIFDAIGIEEVWLLSLTQDGGSKDGSSVAEPTSLIDDKKLPSSTRLIVRREPLYPGASAASSPPWSSVTGVFYTDQEGDPVGFDLDMTLIDSRPQTLASFVALAKESRTPMDLDAAIGASVSSAKTSLPTGIRPPSSLRRQASPPPLRGARRGDDGGAPRRSVADLRRGNAEIETVTARGLRRPRTTAE